MLESLALVVSSAQTAVVSAVFEVASRAAEKAFSAFTTKLFIIIEGANPPGQLFGCAKKSVRDAWAAFRISLAADHAVYLKDLMAAAERAAIVAQREACANVASTFSASPLHKATRHFAMLLHAHHISSSLGVGSLVPTSSCSYYFESLPHALCLPS